MANVKYICGACSESFETDAKYIEHVCPKTDFTPADIEHQDKMTGGQASVVSKAAITRGADRLNPKQ